MRAGLAGHAKKKCTEGDIQAMAGLPAPDDVDVAKEVIWACLEHA
ncbi:MULTISPECIES: hypothetical protein [Halomonadaceae]|nr:MULTISPECIES: hypothetical protein [Halomonas]